MKEMYVKPMVEKILFDNADVISTSGGIDTPVQQTNKSTSDGCTQANGNSGWNLKNKKDKCTKD